MVIHGTPELLKAPTANPVLLEELKPHLRRTDTNEDVSAQQYLDAACEMTESQLACSIMMQQRALYFDYCFPSIIYLRYPPVIDKAGKLIKVEYKDSDSGNYVEFDDSEDRTKLVIDLASRRPRIALKVGEVWPTPAQELNAVKVTYWAGYASAIKVPRRIKQAILLLASTWFNERQDITDTQKLELPKGYRFIIANCKRWV